MGCLVSLTFSVLHCFLARAICQMEKNILYYWLHFQHFKELHGRNTLSHKSFSIQLVMSLLAAVNQILCPAALAGAALFTKTLHRHMILLAPTGALYVKM